MHIAVNTLSVIPGETGGGETYLVNLCQALIPILEEDRITFVVSRQNRRLFEEPAGNVSFHVAPAVFSSPLTRVLYERLFLGRALKHMRPNVVFMPGNAGLPHPPCPEVIAVQSLHYLFVPEEVGRLRTAYFSGVLPRDIEKAALVLAVSNDIAGNLREGLSVPAEKIRVVHEGVSLSFTSVKDQQDLNVALRKVGVQRPYILFVSGLKPYKNTDKAIQALARLNRMVSTPRKLLVIGPDRSGVLPALKALAEKEHVAQHVHFAGSVDHELLPAYYTAAKVFVYPSAIKTFSLPVLEAMACGTPVVGSNLTSVPEVIGDAGLIVDPDDLDAFAGAINRIIEDDAVRKALVNKGFERIKYFNWERAARETLAVLREAADMR